MREREQRESVMQQEEHILCSTWWLVNDLKIDLQMGRFGFGLADLPPDLKIGGVANRFANHFCDFLFANGRFVRTNSTFSVQICQYFFSDRQNDLTFANRPTNSQPQCTGIHISYSQCTGW